MTTTHRPTTCADCGIRLTSANRPDSADSLVCSSCFEAAGQENDHSDNGHDEPQPNCPSCGTYVPPTAKPGHDKGITKSHTSHKGHAHPSTKAARAACRKGRQAPAQATTAAPCPCFLSLPSLPVILSHAATMTKHSFFVMAPGSGSVKDIVWVTKAKTNDWFSSSPLPPAA